MKSSNYSQKTFVLVFTFVFLFHFSSISLFANLKDPNNQADYILIYHSEFENGLKKFIEWRTAKGTNLLSVKIDDIYTEFRNDTITNSQSIWDFISYAIQYWKSPMPKYLLLVGSINHIPSVKMKSEIFDEDSVSMDYSYSLNQFDNDILPDISVGRFPVRDSIELRNIIDKTMSFEDNFNHSLYDNDFLFLIDKRDFSAFDNLSLQCSSNIPYNKKLTRLSNNDSSAIYADKAQIINSLINGTVFLCNHVHGNPGVWFYDKFITTSDIDSLNFNKNPFILTSISCRQNFDNPASKGILETLIAKKDGGAVATYAVSGLNLSSSANFMIYTFYKKLFSNEYSTIGDIILSSKRELLVLDKSADNMYKRYSLLGDPALKFPQEIISTIVEKWADIKGDNFNYPNPFTNKTSISYKLNNSSHVLVKIFDSMGEEIANLVDEQQDEGIHQVNYDGSNLPAGIYFYRIQTESVLFTGAMIHL